MCAEQVEAGAANGGASVVLAGCAQHSAPPQAQWEQAAGPGAAEIDETAKAICVQMSRTPQSKEQMAFKSEPSEDYFLAFAAFFSASSIFFTYLAVFLLKSFKQDLQQSLISRSLWVKT